MQPTLFIFLGGVLAALAVGLGALGAHALKSELPPQQLVSFHTAVQYQMYHAIGLVLVGLLSLHHHSRFFDGAGWSMLVGITLFSGLDLRLVGNGTTVFRIPRPGRRGGVHHRVVAVGDWGNRILGAIDAMNLNDRIMVVTGASSGIGAATAKAAGREHARLVLLARNQAKLEKVAEDIRRNGGAAHPYAVDLTVADAVAEVAKKITAEVGTPDIIFNNAGVGKWLSVEETDPDEAVKMMASPYFAAFFVTRAFLPEMLKRNSGYIINMTSAASRLVWPGATAYIAARWAMHGFTEGLRADLTGTNIRTMLVTFAKVASSYWENNPGSEERLPQAQSMVRVLTPEEAAQAIIERNQAGQARGYRPFHAAICLRPELFFPARLDGSMSSSSYREKAASEGSPKDKR